MTLQIGDRVIRDGKEMGDPKRRGAVVRAYSSMPNGVGHVIPLYDVRWDDTGGVEIGYMDVNLTREAQPSPAQPSHSAVSTRV